MLRRQILTVDPASFEALALAVFRYQAVHNPVYRQYLHYLGVRPEQFTDVRRVPFMPIGFFKQHRVLTGLMLTDEAARKTLTFASSGTTGQDTSRHLVPDPDLYDAVSTRIFEQTYGPLQNVHILALLPSYLERNNSSLVYMVRRFMEQSIHSGSIHSGSEDAPTSTGQTTTVAANFFLNNLNELTNRLRQLTEHPDGKQILLIGVTFALLDWAESEPDLHFLARAVSSRSGPVRRCGSRNPELIVMETGGMKGRRKELLREEVHELLTARLGVSTIHSEYGMTELLSQAYSVGEGVFRPSPTLRVYLRDINDPFAPIPYDLKATGSRQTGERRTGGINVVDLANLDSCSFIETQDLGQYVGENGDFRVIGRFDNSDVRGCNLLIVGD